MLGFWFRRAAGLIRDEPRAPGWRKKAARKIALRSIEISLVAFLRALPRPGLPLTQRFLNAPPAPEGFPALGNMPTISIVTPSYQQGRFLEWTLRSVLEQNYPKLEYVVMDGGSTDETRAILSRYKGQLTHLESAPDEGQADAIARGFEHTGGEIMAYLNSDDVLAPGALDFVARFFDAHPQVDAIYSHRVFLDERNIVTRYWILPRHDTWMMQCCDFIPQETCFWRRSLYREAGGIDTRYQFALDYDLFVRFMQRGRMERVNRFLGAFREHASAKTASVAWGSEHPEVEQVRKGRGIGITDWQRMAARARAEMVDIRSRKFAARGAVLPGALAGIGYDYDLVWRGLLSGRSNSSRSSSDIRPT